MNVKQLATVIIVAASLFGFSQPGWACEKQVKDLREALNDDDEDGICSHQGELRRDKEGKQACKGLNAKLKSLLDDIDEGKIARAAWKIDDFGASLEMLTYSSDPKISAKAYNKLVATKFNAAALCVRRLDLVLPDDD